MMKKFLAILVLNCLSIYTFAQVDSLELVEDDMDSYTEDVMPESEYVEGTFSGTRVINGHSTKTLKKNILEFRIEHRFGDMLPNWDASQLAQTWLGFDQAADIRFGFEYGVTDNFMLGLGRSKGTGAPYRALVDGFVKYKVLSQKKKGMPISLAMLATTSFTYMNASQDSTLVSSFPEWQHRLAYSVQMIIAKKFGNWLSLSLSPTMVHRNFVAPNDANTMFALGGSARFAVSPTMGIIVEYFHAFRDEGLPDGFVRADREFYNSLGLAFEFETFGHNFTINLTNSRGFGETQFIPYTKSDWMNGEFRLGFTIGRIFSFDK